MGLEFKIKSELMKKDLIPRHEFSEHYFVISRKGNGDEGSNDDLHH